MKLTERTLITRVNRVLLKRDERLTRCRKNSRDHHNLGDYYTVLFPHSAVGRVHVDLLELARELGVVKRGETFGRAREQIEDQ
jgi:hypothetical protein